MSTTKLPEGVTLGPNLAAGSTFGLKSRYLVSYRGRPCAYISIKHGWGTAWSAWDLAGDRLAWALSKEDTLKVVADLASQQGRLPDEATAKRMRDAATAERQRKEAAATAAARVRDAGPELYAALRRLLTAVEQGRVTIGDKSAASAALALAESTEEVS